MLTPKLAILNRLEHTLFLSRDRFGIKPLYWAQSGNDLFFASEMKALFCFGISRSPNWEHLGRYLKDGIVKESGEATVFRDICSLRPGHSMLFSKSGTQNISEWWRLPDTPMIDVGRRFEDRVQQFQYLFEDSVRLRVRNDVPTAVSLSGGVDSASVYGACNKLSQEGKLHSASDGREIKKIQACSVIFPGCRNNEQLWIEACIKKWNGQHCYFPLIPSVQNLPRDMDDIVWFQETPVWSPAVFSLHSLYRHVSEAGIRVVLEGHGADEMLGGYPTLIKTALAELTAIPQFSGAWTAFRCLVGVHSVPGSIVPYSKLRGVGLAGSDLLSILKQRFASQITGGRVARTANIPRQFFSREMIATCMGQDTIPGREWDSFEEALRYEFSESTLPSFLRTFDRATMAFGVESCMPFLDHRLVLFAFSLPMTDKVGHLSKHILREAGRDWLPACIRKRSGKTPFTGPIEDWFNSKSTKEYLMDTFMSADAQSSSIIRARHVVDFLEKKNGSRFTYQDVSRFWPALNLYLWDRIVARSSR